MWGLSCLRVPTMVAFATCGCRQGVRFAKVSKWVSSSASQPAISSSPYSTTTSLAGINYLLQYDYVPDVLEKRGPFREGHLNLAKELIEAGKCLSGGPTGPPGMEIPTGALFVFTDEASAKQFVDEDPYVSNGIVTNHEIVEWNVVVEK